MKSKRSLMTVLVGFAMLAMPITAAAKDHGRFARGNSHTARVARSFNVPARTFSPIVVNKHEFRGGPRAMWMPAPAAVARHEWREDHHEWKHGWGDADDYQNYGNGGYYGAPAYAAPVYAAPVYSGYGGYGRNCVNARRVVNTYYRDRNTGHPAAAYDLLRQNQWAFHSGCAVGSPYAGGGLLGAFGGLGGYGAVPAYGNYGGYNGGYGYNGGGYGQPYGGTSMLAPLLQQFIR